MLCQCCMTYRSIRSLCQAPTDCHETTNQRWALPQCRSPALCCALALASLQACFDAWLSRHQDLQATRARVISLLSAAALRWRRESGRKCMRFWHMYTVTVLCGRLAIALPLFRPRLPEFEEWLWHHERGKQLKRQATAMYDRSCLRRFFGEDHQ